MVDHNSEQRLERVHPTLAAHVRTLIQHLATAGLDVRVVQGLRTYAEQDALYAMGRSMPGAIVTNARGGYSNHNFGLAVDVCPFKGQDADWTNNQGFVTIGAFAEKLGLKWGGHWHKFIDKPHLELPGPTLAECRALFSVGGLPAVWEKVN